ncbi:hypothetical protein FRB99_006881 [Tulasnella sp. 403]|nr:hypothetical protein FRB99_006881 [Tulasnella sp. 403]
MADITKVKLGGDANGDIHKVGIGLIRLTLPMQEQPVPDDIAFDVIKTAIDSVPVDRKLFVVSGEFYGRTPTQNLQLIARFFAKYPELADRVFLSVKVRIAFGLDDGGAFIFDKRLPDCSEEGIRKSVDAILKALDGKKSLDMFVPARVDPNVSIEETMETLKKLAEEGKIGHVGLSETKAETIRRANAVHPIVAVEIEVSPWSYEAETKAVIEATKELGIPVIGYCPLGRGFLTGSFNKTDAFLPIMSTFLPRFSAEAMEHNQKIVDILSAAAEKKGVTTAQLCLAWAASLAPHVVPLPGTANPARAKENIQACSIALDANEVQAIKDAVEQHGVKGDRYGTGPAAYSWG